MSYAKYCCEKCGSIITLEDPESEAKCPSCKNSRMELLDKEYYEEEEYKKALKKFKGKTLLEDIRKELSKSHIGDNNLKMTAFLTTVSGLLHNPKRRMSLAVTGNSSEGKDNLIKTALKHTPKDVFIFLTSGTQATIEDDTKDKRIIAFSEMNIGRENGANKYLLEVIKQKTEGGTSAMKKDLRTGMKSARYEQGEQSSILYGTTESLMDEELKTRFIKGTIITDPTRIKRVNDNTLDTFSSPKMLLGETQEKDSWIRVGLTNFIRRNGDICLPYAKFLKDRINGKEIFDSNNPRSQRDLKRILSLTCAMTYLFQEQREKIKHNGINLLVSTPEDFINTLEISGEFFNQSYTGLDARANRVLEIIDSSSMEWVERNFIQEKMETTLNTIKEYCKTLLEVGLIEYSRGKDLNDRLNFTSYNGNKKYIKRCQKGVKKPLIRCEINELKSYLEEKWRNEIDTFLLTHNSDDKKEIKRCQNKGVKKGSGDKNKPILEKIDTFSLTPFDLTEKELESTGLKEEYLDLMKGGPE